MRTLLTLLVPLLAFGTAGVGMFPDTAISRGFMLLTLSVGLLGIVDQMVFCRQLNRPTALLTLAALPLLVGYLACVAVSGGFQKTGISSDFIKVGAQLAIIPAALIYGLSINWSSQHVHRVIALISIGSLTALTLLHVKNGMVTGNVVGGLHSNMLGFLGFLGVFYAMMFLQLRCPRKLVFIMIGVGVATILVSKSRGSLGAIIFFFGMFAVQRFFRLRTLSMSIAYLMIMLSAISVGFVFPRWIETSTAQSISRFSEEQVGKELDTGRSKYWNNAVERFERRPWFGAGTGGRDDWERRLANGEVIRLSVHNVYFAILHEAGMIGLACVASYLFLVWTLLAKRAPAPPAQLGLAFFGATLMHQATETSLFLGTYTLAIPIWIAISFSLSIATGVSTVVSRQSTDRFHWELGHDTGEGLVAE